MKGVLHSGRKTAKESLTVLLTRSAAETDELPLVAVGRVKIFDFKMSENCP